MKYIVKAFVCVCMMCACGMRENVHVCTTCMTEGE